MPRVDWKVLHCNTKSRYRLEDPAASSFNVTDLELVVAQMHYDSLLTQSRIRPLVFARNLLLPRLMNGEIKV